MSKKTPTLTEDIANGLNATKEQIMEVAGELFSQFGYLGVAMSKIARSLGITKAALYYHFESKSDLYIETLEQSLDEFVAELEKIIKSEKLSHRNKLKKVITAYLEIGLKKGSLIQLTIQKFQKDEQIIINSVTKVREQITSLLEPVITDLLKAKGKLKKINGLLMTKLLMGMLDSYLLQRLFKKDNQWEPAEIARQVDVALFD